MTDITERLRGLAKRFHAIDMDDEARCFEEGADEIDHLERLRRTADVLINALGDEIGSLRESNDRYITARANDDEEIKRLTAENAELKAQVSDINDDWML